MRVTQHSGRTHRNGKVYSTYHNDRNFSAGAPNIDQIRTLDNTEWNCVDGFSIPRTADGNPLHTFDDVEQEFYEQHYQQQLDATNKKYLRARHKERVKTMSQWRKQKKHAPEEIILQIGKAGERPDVELFYQCFLEYKNHLDQWNQQHGNCMHILNWALHQDEIGAAHVHLRRVWDYFNPSTGYKEIGQEKALEAAGVALPHPDKPIGRHNNRKMTFDAEMRIIWQNIAISNGLDIETTPLPENEVGMSLDQKIRQNEAKRQKELQSAEKKHLEAQKKLSEAEDKFKKTDKKEKEINQREIEIKEEKILWDKNKKLAQEYLKKNDINSTNYSDLTIETPPLLEPQDTILKKESRKDFAERNLKNQTKIANNTISTFKKHFKKLVNCVRMLLEEIKSLQAELKKIEQELKIIKEEQQQSKKITQKWRNLSAEDLINIAKKYKQYNVNTWDDYLKAKKQRQSKEISMTD